MGSHPTFKFFSGFEFPFFFLLSVKLFSIIIITHFPRSTDVAMLLFIRRGARGWMNKNKFVSFFTQHLLFRTCFYSSKRLVADLMTFHINSQSPSPHSHQPPSPLSSLYEASFPPFNIVCERKESCMTNFNGSSFCPCHCCLKFFK